MNDNSKMNAYDYFLQSNACYQKAHKLSIEFIFYAKEKMTQKDFIIVSPILNQCVRSSTSIAANISEGITPGISTKDKINKFSIAYKESIETLHWLSTLHDMNELSDDDYNAWVEECTQITKMLNASILTLREQLNTKTKSKQSK